MFCNITGQNAVGVLDRNESALAAAAFCGGKGLRVAGEHFNGKADFTGPADVRAWLAAMADALEARAGTIRAHGA